MEQWAVIDLLGRNRIAGRISEHTIGGVFLRVDVPAVGGNAAFTKLYAPNSVYSIAFVDKDVALAVAEKLDSVPVKPYEAGELTAAAIAERLKSAKEYEDYDSLPF